MLPFTKTLIVFKKDISGASTKMIMIFSQKYDESLHGFDIAYPRPGTHIKLHIFPENYVVVSLSISCRIWFRS